MSEALQTERSPASVASATAGRDVGNIQRVEDNMSALVNEAEAKRLTASQELSSIDQWVAWKYLPALPSSRTGKPRKVPVDPKNGGAAKVNDPLTWASFDAAFERAKKDRLSGVGFVLRRENDLTMIDLDGCIDERGQLEPWAAEIVALGETYCETSPSGKGLRMFARGTVDHAVSASDVGVELYSELRYCTVTGKRRPESPLTINEAPQTIEALKARVEAHKRKQAEPLPMQRQEQAPLSERAKASAPAYDGTHAGGDERRYIEMALDYISSDNRDTWLKIGGALHDSGEPWARAVWDEWARRSSKFNATDQAKTWASFARETGRKATVGTIIHMARENGFTATKHDHGPDVGPAQLATVREFREKLTAKGGKDSADKADNDEEGAGDAMPEGKRLKFIFDGEDATTPPPSLVKGLLPFEGVAMLGGQSGAGKTFIAVNLAVALASGKSFFGRKIAERVGVVIVAAEGAATIASRVAAAREGADSDGELLPISWIADAGDLRQSDALSRLVGGLKATDARMQRQYGTRLGAVIIDTLGAAFSMADENSNAEANLILRSLHALSKATGALILPVHHYGKSSETGLRGASAWRAGCDAVLSVLAERNEVTGDVSNRRIALAKSRVGEEGGISGFTLVPVMQGVDADGEAYSTCTVLAIESDATAQKERRLKRDERAYLKALNVKMDNAERIFPFGTEGAEVQAVDRETIRAEFYASVSADGASAEQKANAKRQAFRRGERGLLDRQQICLRDVGGREMVWIIADDRHDKP